MGNKAKLPKRQPSVSTTSRETVPPLQPKKAPLGTHHINLAKEFCKFQTKPALCSHTHPPFSTQDSFFTAQPVSQGKDPSWQGSAVLCCSYSRHTMVYLQRAAACPLSIHSQTSFECNGREQESSRQPLYCKENNPKSQWPFFPLYSNI